MQIRKKYVNLQSTELTCVIKHVPVRTCIRYPNGRLTFWMIFCGRDLHLQSGALTDSQKVHYVLPSFQLKRQHWIRQSRLPEFVFAPVPFVTP